MGIETWGRVNGNLKWLTEAYNDPYFDLCAFCNIKGLDYDEIVDFINVGNSICSGELDCSYELRQHYKKHKNLIIHLKNICLEL